MDGGVPSFGAVVVGVLLLGVPTFFGVIPEAADWPLWVRGELAWCWLALAFVAVVTSASRDRDLSNLMRVTRRARDNLAEATLDEVLHALIDEGRGRGLPNHYRISVYLFDNDRRYLMPAFPEAVSDRTDPRVFEIGKGATGIACRDEKPSFEHGPDVSNEKRGLTAAQQAYFADDQFVGAVPIRTENDRVIGALTMISERDEGPRAAENHMERLIELAVPIGALFSRFGGLPS